MTSIEMLVRVRTLLDESSAGFWADSEIYSALSDGQREVANILLSFYKAELKINPDADVPDNLRDLIDSAGGTIADNTVALPSDFWHPIAAKYSYNATSEPSRKPARIRALDNKFLFREVNTYTTASADDPFCYFNSTSVIFSPSISGSGSYNLLFLQETTEITSAINPILGKATHQAICQYAFSVMLKKDEKINESNVEFGVFLQIIQTLR